MSLVSNVLPKGVRRVLNRGSEPVQNAGVAVSTPGTHLPK